FDISSFLLAGSIPKYSTKPRYTFAALECSEPYKLGTAGNGSRTAPTRKEVLMKRLMALLISGALILGSAGLVTAQSQTAQESDNDSIKKPAKDAGHDTKRAAKATGKKVKKTTKKVVHK